MQYCFDTSALNRLYDDSDRDALIATFLSTGTFWISAYNVLEAGKTKDVGRRHELVRMMKRLANDRPPLSHPSTLVRAVARAYAEAGPSGEPIFSANNDPELEGLWVALNNPDLLDEETRQEALRWASQWEGDYDAIAHGARDRFQRVFNAAPHDRPRTAAGNFAGIHAK